MKLNLPFDIDGAEGISPGRLEELGTLGTQESNVVFLLLDEMLTVVVDNELASLVIGFKAEFFGNESNLDILLISGND